MVSNNKGRVPNIAFYDKHPHGPCAKGKGTWRDDLGHKGLMVNRTQLTQIKDFLFGQIKAKIYKGEWEPTESFKGASGAQKRMPLIDAGKEKFSARFRWDRIPEKHKGWPDLALAKLLVLVKSRYVLEMQKPACPQAAASLTITASREHYQKASSHASKSPLRPPVLPVVPTPTTKLPNPLPLLFQDSPPRSKNGFDQQIHQEVITEQIKRHHSTASQPPQGQQGLPEDIGLTSDQLSIQDTISPDTGLLASIPPAIGLPSHTVQLGPVQPEPSLQLSSLGTQSQSPALAQDGIYQQMTIVVHNAIIKGEDVDEHPWEDILVEYLTDEGKIKAFNRLMLLWTDFSLDRLKAKLADSSQSPFGFEEDLHELVHIGEFKELVIKWEAAWRTILQQAANKGKKKLVFKVRNKQS